MTFNDRFWAKVDKSGDCWTWTASKCTQGYGVIRNSGVLRMSHRVSYEIHFGSIPEGMVIDHKCHNKACVKPDHLQAVSQSENQQNRKGSQKNSSSGVRGVYWHKPSGKWQAQVTHNRKTMHIGVFDTIEDAERAVVEKRLELHKNNLRDRLDTLTDTD